MNENFRNWYSNKREARQCTYTNLPVTIHHDFTHTDILNVIIKPYQQTVEQQNSFADTTDHNVHPFPFPPPRHYPKQSSNNE